MRYKCPRCGDMENLEVELPNYFLLDQSGPGVSLSRLYGHPTENHIDAHAPMVCGLCEFSGEARAFDTQSEGSKP
jgi:hypothetical protein